MNLTHVLRHGSDVHNRLLTEARETHNPVVTVQRIEEAAALEHLLRIARLHLQPAPAPDIAEAMGGLGEILQSIDHASFLGTAILYALSRTHGKKGVPALPAIKSSYRPRPVDDAPDALDDLPDALPAERTVDGERTPLHRALLDAMARATTWR